MSRTVHYDTNGNEIYEEESTNDAPTYAQEQLADIAAKMDDAIKEQEEYFGAEIDYMSSVQLLTVAAKLIGVTERR